ncbi:hypothetical protein LIER_31683 [Lithospermum erythrorhizon]|uniref:Uncharacterized protein n=1 Tax=Lithospermum erythrorhizon TaxID=34254 RepID=A0AAV3RUU1_LITER
MKLKNMVIDLDDDLDEDGDDVGENGDGDVGRFVGCQVQEVCSKSVVTELGGAKMLVTMTFRVARANTTMIKMVGGIHIKNDPIVPNGILKGLKVAGCSIPVFTKAANSMIIPKQ